MAVPAEMARNRYNISEVVTPCVGRRHETMADDRQTMHGIDLETLEGIKTPVEAAGDD